MEKVSLVKLPVLEKSFTTAKSKVTGTVKEIVENAGGSLRVRLELPDGSMRWTTVQ